MLLDTVFLGRDSFRSVNLIPLHTIKEYIMVDNGIGGIRMIDMNIWGNVLMFIPSGVYLSLHTKTNSIFKKKLFILTKSVY